MNKSNENVLIIEKPQIDEKERSDLLIKIDKLETLINQAILNPSNNNNTKIKEIENELYESEKVFNKMDIELKSYSQKTKEKYKYPYIKSKIKQLKGNFKELENIITNQNLNNIDDEARVALINNSNSIEQGIHQIKESIKMMSDTNNNDNNTKESLVRQGNIISNTTDILNKTKEYLKKSSKAINSIIYTSMTNKFILIGIIILLSIINIILIYHKIKKKVIKKIISQYLNV